MRGGLLVLTLLLLSAPVARAQNEPAWLSPLSLRGELGVAGMLASYQQSALRQELGAFGAVRVGVAPVQPLVVQLSYESWMFPSALGDAQQHALTAGVRVEPFVADLVWLVADANLGVAFTGPLTRFTMSFALGADVATIGRTLGVGLFARYAHTFAANEDWPSDAMMLSGGLSVTLRGTPPPPAAERDGDGDGVIDRDDVCPTAAEGSVPDPARRGCPAGDADGDGVPDHDDPCPTTPAGAHPDPNRPGCPDADRDADGVVDSLDACPELHSGLNPDPERPGCGLADRDSDSVIDRDDTCPDEFGAPSPDRRQSGCPGLVRVEHGMIRILRPVFFASGRDVLLDESGPVLRAVADALLATPTIRRLAIEGHTDDVGEEELNLELSRRRAQNIMAVLIQAGVEPSRLEFAGFGESRPLLEADSEQARAVNRRVEFRIVDPPQQ